MTLNRKPRTKFAVKQNPTQFEPNWKQYDLLQIIYRHDCLSTLMVREIAGIYGIDARGGTLSDDIRGLQAAGLIAALKVRDGTKRLAYRVTQEGYSHIEVWGDNLEQEFDERQDPRHWRKVLGINQEILALRQCLKVRNWVTAINVRSQRNANDDVAFAADYDAVLELMLPAGTVRTGIIFEAKPRRNDMYQELSSRIGAEDSVHALVFVMGQLGIVDCLAPAFAKSRCPAIFVDREELFAHGYRAAAFFWENFELMPASLNVLLDRAASRRIRDLELATPFISSQNYFKIRS